MKTNAINMNSIETTYITSLASGNGQNVENIDKLLKIRMHVAQYIINRPRNEKINTIDKYADELIKKNLSISECFELINFYNDLIANVLMIPEREHILEK